MGLHSVTWRVNVSALDDCDLIEESLKWISGEKSTIQRIKDKSFHGGLQYTIVAQVNKKREAVSSLRKIGTKILKYILEEGIEIRVDDSKNLHIRLELAELVKGQVHLANRNTTAATVKGQFKIESYPGQSVIEVISDLIKELIDES